MSKFCISWFTRFFAPPCPALQIFTFAPPPPAIFILAPPRLVGKSSAPHIPDILSLCYWIFSKFKMLWININKLMAYPILRVRLKKEADLNRVPENFQKHKTFKFISHLKKKNKTFKQNKPYWTRAHTIFFIKNQPWFKAYCHWLVNRVTIDNII